MDSPVVTLEPIRFDDKLILRNLMSFYLHDLSEVIEVSINPHGTFEHGRLDNFWTDWGKHSYFIKADGHLAGFVMVLERDGNGGTNHIDHFFVLRGFRRRGIGKQAAKLAFSTFQGQWEVRVWAQHKVAQKFWRDSINTFSNGKHSRKWIEDRGRRWLIQRFTTHAQD